MCSLEVLFGVVCAGGANFSLSGGLDGYIGMYITSRGRQYQRQMFRYFVSVLSSDKTYHWREVRCGKNCISLSWRFALG